MSLVREREQSTCTRITMDIDCSSPMIFCLCLISMTFIFGKKDTRIIFSHVTRCGGNSMVPSTILIIQSKIIFWVSQELSRFNNFLIDTGSWMRVWIVTLLHWIEYFFECTKYLLFDFLAAKLVYLYQTKKHQHIHLSIVVVSEVYCIMKY